MKLIHKLNNPLRILNKVYLPGICILDYTWQPIEEHIQRWYTLDELNPAKLYYKCDCNQRWVGWMVKFHQGTWRTLDYDKSCGYMIRDVTGLYTLDVKDIDFYKNTYDSYQVMLAEIMEQP